MKKKLIIIAFILSAIVSYSQGNQKSDTSFSKEISGSAGYFENYLPVLSPPANATVVNWSLMRLWKLPDLSPCTKLKRLYCNSDSLEDLNLTNKNTELVHVECSFNNFRTFELSPNDSLINFFYVCGKYAQHAPCKHIWIPPTWRRLQQIDVSYMSLDSLYLSPNFTKIDTLWIFSNFFTDSVHIPNTYHLLQYLEADDCQLTSSYTPAGLTSLNWLNVANNRFTGSSFKIANSTSLANLAKIFCQNNLLTNVTIGDKLVGIVSMNFASNLITTANLPNTLYNLYDCNFQNNALTQASVDDILLKIDQSGAYGGGVYTCHLYLDLGTNSAPTGGSSNANYLNLISKGWIITKN